MAQQRCGCIILDNGVHSHVEQKWENERYTPITGKWKEPSLILPTDPKKWTNKKRDRPRIGVNLPENWKWSQDWQPTVSKDTDEVGWMYGTTFNSLHKKCGKLDVVRSRKWARRRMYIGIDGRCKDWRKDRTVGVSHVDQVVRDGWLEKRGDDLLKKYKKRFFVLTTDNQMFYYTQNPAKSKKKVEPKGVIQIRTIERITEYRDGGREFGFKLRTGSRAYVLSAQFEGERRGWISTIQEAVEKLKSGLSDDILDSYNENMSFSGQSLSDNTDLTFSRSRSDASISRSLKKPKIDDTKDEEWDLVEDSLPLPPKLAEQDSTQSYTSPEEREKEDTAWLEKAEELERKQQKKAEEDAIRRAKLEQERLDEIQKQKEEAKRQKELRQLQKEIELKQIADFPSPETKSPRRDSDNNILLSDAKKKRSRWRYLCQCFQAPGPNEPINL